MSSLGSPAPSPWWARPRRVGAPGGLVLELPRDPGAIAVSRRRLRRLDGELHAGRLGELQLVVTELITNALVHGEGAIRLDVQVSFCGVHGEVTDEGGGFTYEPRPTHPAALSGRGLHIVDTLTSEWGIEPGVSRVWFRMDSGPRRPGPPRR